MISLPFIKMHGCGNDYVFIDGMASNASEYLHINFADVARQMSDRHRGIGSDGLVLMLHAESNADARMKMFNADGSEGALCGNALRCMAMWLHQSGHCNATCRIEMHDRLIHANILNSDAALRHAIVRVTIGKPVVSSADAVGLQQYVRHLALPDVLLQGQPITLWSVSMGNPHAVVVVDEMDPIDIQTLGPQLEQHSQFPDRTNVEFMQIVSRSEAVVRVWERGSGETQACGSGACAAAMAGWACDLFDLHTPVSIRMAGGYLTVEVTPDHVISLQGPAQESFRGEFCLRSPTSLRPDSFGAVTYLADLRLPLA